MYNKAISKKIITTMILIIMLIAVVSILIISVVCKNMRMEQAAITLDENHVQALNDAGFTEVEGGYIKEDVTMSFQVHTVGTKSYTYPYVMMLFADDNDAKIQSEQIIYDPLNKLYIYSLNGSEITVEMELNSDTFEIIESKIENNADAAETGEEENSDNADVVDQKEVLKERILEKLEKFYITFGISVQNTLGKETPQYILDNSDNYTTFGMDIINNICIKKNNSYVYTSDDNKIELAVYPNGGDSYEQPYITINDKTAGINSTIVPLMNTIVCSYAENTTLINVAYDLNEDEIILYKEGSLNKTEKYADDAVMKSKIKDIYNKKNEYMKTLFNMSSEMLLRHNETYDFSTEQNNDDIQNDNS
jgi:hypothetical protein